ncbi:MAG: zf-HC2 domain-containing protein [Anaerolineales bacterium]|nr:zf-HC2 domain-containing protein [Anaerolineales bacterium]
MKMHNSPSRHLSDDELFEYLDQALPQEQLDEIDAHLEICQTCAGHLADHSTLFSTIEGLSDERLIRDLTPEVLTAIKKGAVPTPIWGWLLILQGILALGLIAITAPSIVNYPLTFSLLESGRDVLASLAANLSVWLQQWISLIGKTNQLFTFRIPFSLGLPLQSILWLLLLATVAWIVGNSILLRSQFKRTER